MSDEPKQVVCPVCGGYGVIEEEIIQYVTRDMAIDAGDWSMEGMPIYETIEHQCKKCEGVGTIESEASNE